MFCIFKKRIKKSEQQDLNLRPHGPQPCALPNYAMLRIYYPIVTDLKQKFNHFLKKSVHVIR